MFNQLENKNTVSLLGISMGVKSLIGITAIIFNVFVVSVFAVSLSSMSPMIADEELESEIVLAVTKYVEPPKTEPIKTTTAVQSVSDDKTPVRTQLQLATDDVRKVPDQVRSAGNSVPPIPRAGNVKIGKINSDPSAEGFERSDNPGGGQPTGGKREIPDNDVAPEPKPTAKPTPAPTPIPKPAETPKPEIPKLISKGVINGLASNLVKPVYSAAAKAVNAGGAVTVQVTIDETGRVIAANAVNGHPLLRAAAEAAARQSKFTPTLLSNQPVKVTGTIIYNFVRN